jgi:hypothetical protein
MAWAAPVHFQRFSSQVLSLFCHNRGMRNLYKERRHCMGKLKEQMKMDMELKNFSLRTIDTYLACVKSFVAHYKRSPELMGIMRYGTTCTTFSRIRRPPSQLSTRPIVH